MSGRDRAAVLRTLVVDDEPLAREGIRLRLAGEPDIELVGEAGDGEEAIRAIAAHRPDLVFLDVQMPGKDGFQVLEEVAAIHLPVVIFVTAHDRHAVRAFEAHALDYLLKPVSEARLRHALGRAREEVKRNAGTFPERAGALLDRQAPGAGSGALSRLVVPDRGRFLLLRIEDVDSLQSEGNYVRVNARSGAGYLLRGTLTSFLARLPSRRFARIHRTTIVNIEQVAEIRTGPNGDFDVALRSGAILKMSRVYRAALLP